MINNWEYHKLNMDYKNIECPIGKPSDIDLFYITSDGFLILGEIKNGPLGKFKPVQKWLLSRIIDSHTGGGAILLYAVHDKLVQNGDSTVDVSQCLVVECYYKGEWIHAWGPVTVNELFQYLTKGEH